jgi:hypothetical protein
MTTRIWRRLSALAAAAFFAFLAAGCAPNALSQPYAPGTNLTDPTGGIDYHGGRYRMFNG